LLDRHVEARWPGLYYNPARWQTADGYIPFPVFDLYAAALWPVAAIERMNMAQAIGLVMAGKDDAKSLRDATLNEAFPGED
jgi:hypothetical protein